MCVYMFHKIITEELVHIGSEKEKELGSTAKNVEIVQTNPSQSSFPSFL